MGNNKFTILFLKNIYKCSLQNIAKRAAHTEANARALNEISGSNLRASLEERLKHDIPLQNDAVSIYKVPTDLGNVEPKAYEPNIISIGPSHHGAPHLEGMQELKWSFFHRLFNQSEQRGANLERVINELKQSEQEARRCYENHESLMISSDKFIEIMLLDGCFIVELLRELRKSNFRHGSNSLKRWMLPVLRRDLITLENQLPLFVLQIVYDLTSSRSKSTILPCLEELALQFFDPLLSRDPNTLGQSLLAPPGGSRPHLLDLFRASIVPKEISRGKQPHMFRSIAELQESGVKLRIAKDQQPLEVSFKKGLLKIPPLHFEDHAFTLLRNMVAFEQCHFDCKPDITMYIFFLDGLINSGKDVEILHYAGIMQHSLGGNKQVARLVNKLCNQVTGDVEQSYLHSVVWKINCYCNDGLIAKRARLKHDYFFNPWVSISTVAVIFVFYLTLLQTYCSLESSRKDLNIGFWTSLKDSFYAPFTGIPRSRRTRSAQISKNFEDGSQDDNYILRIKPSKKVNATSIKISPEQFKNIQSIFFSISC